MILSPDYNCMLSGCLISNGNLMVMSTGLEPAIPADPLEEAESLPRDKADGD